MDDATRTAHERWIQRKLATEFHAQRKRVLKSGIATGWDTFQENVTAILQERLEKIYQAAAFALVMLIVGDNSTSGSIWAKLLGGIQPLAHKQSASVARRLRVSVTREIAEPSDIRNVLTPSRAEAIAITETTTAHSAGENVARMRIESTPIPVDDDPELDDDEPGSPPKGDGPDGGGSGDSGDGDETTPASDGDGKKRFRARRTRRPKPGQPKDGAKFAVEVEWWTSRDNKVCPVCHPLDRQPESAWKDKFPNGPPAHPRCRCKRRYVRK